MRSVLLTCCLIFPCTVAAWEPQAGCEQIMQECFAENGVSRSQCLNAAARHSVCAHSDLRHLAAERWAIAPEQNQAPAFTGPQIVDKSCLENFDNKWSSMLIARGITQAAIETLRHELQSCRQEAPLDFPRL
ncbi:MAG: hypothetical protein QY326_05260 [Bdellovibrionota bacterium]|nr:MAG: hypothetical protein QY326_05260 [Bdellovibrionota bacterium]